MLPVHTCGRLKLIVYRGFTRPNDMQMDATFRVTLISDERNGEELAAMPAAVSVDGCTGSRPFTRRSHGEGSHGVQGVDAVLQQADLQNADTATEEIGDRRASLHLRQPRKMRHRTGPATGVSLPPEECVLAQVSRLMSHER